MRKILVVQPQVDENLRPMILEIAERYGAQVEWFSRESDAEEALPEAEVIYGYMLDKLPLAKSLKWLCLPSAGVDHVLKSGVLPEDVLLTNSAGAYGLTLSEHMVMLTLMLLRRMPEFFTSMEKRQWSVPLPQRSIKDSRVTLLGAGDIGKNYARRLVPFEPARITAVSRSGVSSEPAFDEVVPISRLDEVLPRTDILVMSLPGTAETVGILSAERLALLPKTAYVVNVGRGNAIDEDALRDALNHHRLAGAALDVMQHEPLPADDPLWDTKNLLMTPHVAGNLTVAYTRRRNVEMFCEDLENYFEGRPLLHTVNRKLGY